jgi:hypothetical protein
MLGASNDTLIGQEVLAPETWTDHLLDYLERGRTGGLAGAWPRRHCSKPGRWCTGAALV